MRREGEGVSQRRLIRGADALAATGQGEERSKEMGAKHGTEGTAPARTHPEEAAERL